jgi:hypothetical protein
MRDVHSRRTATLAEWNYKNAVRRAVGNPLAENWSKINEDSRQFRVSICNEDMDLSIRLHLQLHETPIRLDSN